MTGLLQENLSYLETPHFHYFMLHEHHIMHIQKSEVVEMKVGQMAGLVP